MIQEIKRRSFLPYGILGCFLFYIGHYLYKLSLKAPMISDYDDLFGIQRLLWTLDRATRTKPIDFHITEESLMVGAGGFFIALILYMRVQRLGIYRPGEEYGSARFATEKELEGFQDKLPYMNIIFSKRARMGLLNRRLPYQNQVNKNVLVVGTPGDGKTFTYIKPNLMQLNSSYVVTEPKGLLIRETGSMFENAGYQIKILDLINLANSDQFNPFCYMKTELDIDKVAEAIVEGTKKGDNKGDEFWERAELLFMRSLLAYLYFDSKREDYMPHLGYIADMLRHLERTVPDVESPVELMFQELEEAIPGNYANRQWALFNNMFKSETRSSVMAILATRFSVFDHDVIRQITERDTMAIETWNTTKTVVFIHIPETNTAFNFLAAVLFTTVFEVLTHKADDILQGRHPIFKPEDLLPVQFEMDEFANIGKIPSFVEVLSSIRSRDMSASVIIQALSQLSNLYGSDKAKTIINNCGTLLYLGTNDKDTMEYLSMRSGKMTINDFNQNETRSRNGSTSVNYSKLGRELLTPHEVATIGIEEALVYIAKQNVFRDKKASVNDHPRAKELANAPTDKNWYRYVRYMTDLDAFLSYTRPSNCYQVTDDDVKSIELSV